MAERPHGYVRYKADGCSCYVCAFAASEYRLDVARRKAAGTWQPFVDAGPVRAHLTALAAQGIGYKRAAALAGVAFSTVATLLFGGGGKPPRAKVRTQTAERLLAVEPVHAPRAIVDGVGTTRRIQALCCLGWTLTYQAGQIGWEPRNFLKLTTGRPVVAATAALVSDLYERLSGTPAPAGPSATRVRRMAERKGWAPPLAWNDGELDNPSARPRAQRQMARPA